MAGKKFSDILKFLDEVETSDETASVAASIDNSHCGSLLAETVVSGLRQRIGTLQQEIQQKDRQAAALKKKLLEMKARETANLEQMQQEMQQQKVDLEGALARNMQFVKTLLEDKEALNSKVESLSQELKALAEKHDKRVAELEERNLSFATTQKSQWTNAEKRRRAAWQEEQTRKIKAETLKMLEPDIAQLMSRHRQEKQRLENERDEEFRRRDALLAQKDRELTETKQWLESVKIRELAAKDVMLEQKDRELVDQRARLARDYEQSLMREREFFQQQIKEQGDRFERQLDELRLTLREAKEREAEAVQQLNQELGAEKARLRAEKATQMAEFEEQLRLKLDLETQTKRRQLKEELDAAAAAELAQHKKLLEEERDAEIEMVIQRLEESTLQSQKAAIAAEKAWMEKHSCVVHEKEALAVLVEDLQEQLLSVKAMAAQKQKQVEASAAALQDAQEEHAIALKELQTKLMRKIQQTDELWGAKYATRIQDQTEVIDQQAARICELQRMGEQVSKEHKEELKAAQQQHEAELEQLRVRVTQALAKKDTAIQELQAMVLRAEERNRQIEDVLLAQSA